jgi:membrane-associated protein
VIDVLAQQPLLLGMDWMDPAWLLDRFGAELFWVSMVIIFIECGLFFPFLPGDTLLFALGLFINSEAIDLFPGGPLLELLISFVLLTTAAFLGNVVGYEIGRAAGPKIFSKPDSRIFRQEYVDKTMAFFDRYGARAIVLARFVPIVRTFITVTAGVGRMDRRKYLVFSAIGAVLWATGVTVLGYSLGSVEFIHQHLEVIALLIVAISVVPMAIEFLRERNKQRRSEREVATRATEVVREAEQH